MLNAWQKMKRPPWRTLVSLCAIFVLACLFYIFWTPGENIRDGRHDLGKNGIWLQHGWLANDAWLESNKKDKQQFRNPERIRQLADLLGEHGIRYVYPHLCPCHSNGDISPFDPVQMECFLDHFENFKVLPWISGVLDQHCRVESPDWQNHFVNSCKTLLAEHLRLSGIHINIEPMPTGSQSFIDLLKTLRKELPKDKILSVAAYPPPTRLHPVPEVHWDETYFRQVAQSADQMVVMMYDTAVRLPKLYQNLVADWTEQCLTWSNNCNVLLGVPAYDDETVGYHHPDVENITNSLLGIHAGLLRFEQLPKNYEGIAIYCQWEMDSNEWNQLKTLFEKHKSTTQP